VTWWNSRGGPGENHFAIWPKYGLRLILVQDKLLSLVVQLYLDEYLPGSMEFLGGPIFDAARHGQPDIDCGHHSLL
jgi:hypothetical protein